MIILKEKNFFVLKISKGQLVLAEIEKLVLRNKIKSAFFTGIGALNEVELAHYNVKKQKYSSKKYQEELELTSLIGNIAWYKGKPIIHAHAVLANSKMIPIAGHLVEGRVSGTGEIFLTIFNKKIEKEFDKETGLKLMKGPRPPSQA